MEIASTVLGLVRDTATSLYNVTRTSVVVNIKNQHKLLGIDRLTYYTPDGQCDKAPPAYVAVEGEGSVPFRARGTRIMVSGCLACHIAPMQDILPTWTPPKKKSKQKEETETNEDSSKHHYFVIVAWKIRVGREKLFSVELVDTEELDIFYKDGHLLKNYYHTFIQQTLQPNYEHVYACSWKIRGVSPFCAHIQCTSERHCTIDLILQKSNKGLCQDQKPRLLKRAA
jgi:hypothetical protein